MSKVVHMEKGPIGKTLLLFALPVLISQVLQELYNITDCAIVGHFAGGLSLAATGIAGLLLSVFINFFIGFSSGVSVVTGRLFGKYDYPGLKKTINSVMRLTILTGIIVTVLTSALTGLLLKALNCPEEVVAPASLYLHICAFGLSAQLIYNVGAAILRSLGDTRAPLMCFFFSCITNLTLDILFVIVLKMGIAGAATATLISQWLLAVMIFVRLKGLGEECSLELRGEHLSLKELLDILRTGIPAGLQALFMSISSLLLQTCINSFGPAAVAGMTCYAKLEGLVYFPAFSYGIALTGFVGQNYGAGRMDRIQEAVRISNRLMWAVIMPLSLIVAFASPVLLRVFTNDPDIIFNAHEALIWNMPPYVIYAMNQVYLGAIKGKGRTFYPMICTLICYSIFRVLWCNALIPVFNTMIVVYLSYDVSFFLMLFMLLPVYRSEFFMRQGDGAFVSLCRKQQRKLSDIIT
ncbi:MAG: MATE family efflux transporter [Lachnospiraceae bacterium]|nr:MATE family efflux transporter [Lachnospiraceae bacterium]